jgi:hypothetical protein
MRAEVVQGTRQQIADRLTRIDGNVVEAIFFVDEASNGKTAPPLTDDQFEQLLREMKAQTVSVGRADYSRQSIYSPMEGE